MSTECLDKSEYGRYERARWLAGLECVTNVIEN